VFETCDSKIKEVTNSGFDSDQCTLYAATLEDDTQVQVTKRGILHIQPALNKIARWNAGGEVKAACSNGRQIALAIEGG